MLAAAIEFAPAVQATAWQGFSISTVPSETQNGTSPAWSGAITTDLGGPDLDVWSNNHFFDSEALIGLATPGATITRASEYGAVGFIDTHGSSFTDIDGDGDEDLIEVMGRTNSNRVFRNNGGNLVPIAPGNLDDFDGRGRQQLPFDFDGDGDMDILITNLDLREPPVNAATNSPSTIYLNDGTGTSWTPVPNPSNILFDGNLRIAQLTSTGPATPPIVITHNSFTVATDSLATGVSTIQNAANPATVRTAPTHVRDVVLGDFDGDLHPEIVIARGNATTAAATGGPLPLQIFDIVEGSSPVASPALPTDPLIDNCRSVAAGDFDNDGDLDIFGGCSQLQEGQNRNVVLLNDGTGNFTIASTNVLPASIAETAAGLAVGDLDGNGWLDLWVGNGYDNETAPDHLLINQGGSGAHYLSVELEGSNPDAMGAQVFVGTDSWQVRETGHRIRRGQDQRALHFGLGAATEVAPLEIVWPDGTIESCTVSGVDQTVQIQQGGANCTPRTTGSFLSTISAVPVIAAPLDCTTLTPTVDLAAGQSPTSGDDIIFGTNGDDVIIALGGDDIVCGLAGNDTISAGPGNDTVFAGVGDDTVFGLDGNDTIFGGAGDDELLGFANDDTIEGGAGNDTINGGPGNDMLSGQGDSDRIFGQTGNDTIVGGDGADFVVGLSGVDTITGGPGDDVLNGGADGDTITGNAGNDTIFGLTGNDTLNGGNGNDTIFGQPGDDGIDGGPGDDLLAGNEDDDTITDPSGTNTLNGGAGNDAVTGGTGNDQMFGDGSLAQAGNDTLDGGAGQDLILGFAGNDTITANDGDPDTVNGGPGTDSCNTDVGVDTVFFCES